MAYYQSQPQQPYGSAQNLNFYQSTYATQPVSGTSTPFQAFNGGAQAGYAPGFGVQPGVSGRMGEQGGLRTGWIAAFGTEGYEGEPPLLEELGVNFGHIKTKVRTQILLRGRTWTRRLGGDLLIRHNLQTLTVLNPLARIDQHIMDDSDLAGPILFFLLFGTFLLLVSLPFFTSFEGRPRLTTSSLASSTLDTSTASPP